MLLRSRQDMPEGASEEVSQLRRTMRDLVALSTLPAVWTGYGPERIAENVADVLVSMLSLDLLYLRLRSGTGNVVEVARSGQRPEAADRVQAIGEALAPYLRADITDPPPSITDPLGEGTLRVALVRFGHTGERGVVLAGCLRRDFPTATERLLLGVGVNLTAVVMERKLAEEALRKQTERLRLLWEAASVLLTADNPDAMLHGLLAKIGPHLGVDTYFNFMVNDRGDALQLASCQGIPAETAETIQRLEFGQAICGAVAVRRAPIVATHIQQSSEAMTRLAKSFGLRAYACNPLLSGDLLLGTLSFATRSRDEFEPDEVAFLETICQYVTVAYERMRLLGQLQEGDRRKDEFLATLAHELRNPLAALCNAVKVVRLKETDVPEARLARSILERQLEQLIRLVDDLLDISRISRNKLELCRQRVELTEVINAAVESSRPAMQQRGHGLTVTLPREPVHLQADMVRLTQVFTNLLNNAAKFTMPKGRIWLTAERRSGDIVVLVKDTGVGIPAEKLSRVFDMFFQVDGSLERSQAGLGVGLSLVRQLVELHGGSVEAHSAGLGKGSEFLVRLPILAEASGPPQDLRGDDDKKGIGKRRILVIDDNQDSVDALIVLLRLSGHEVQSAYDGLRGIEVAQAFRPDVVLLDIGMPGLNGHDVCRRIRDETWGRDTIVVALTGWGQEEDRHRTVAAGFDAHLVKPVDLPDLMKLLTSLSRRQEGWPTAEIDQL